MSTGSFPVTAPTRGTYDWLRLRVAMYLRKELGDPSLGAVNYDSMDTYQIAILNELVQSGVEQFYYPPPLGTKVPYEWSFLKPEGTIATVNTDFDYDLPADFGGIAQDFTFTTTNDKPKPKLVPPEQIMALRGNGTLTGTPQYIAIRPKTHVSTAKQAFEAIVYPTPTAVETLRYRYLVAPSLLTSVNLYPYGPLVHAETIAASCMAMAETVWKGTSEGPMNSHFMNRLRASLAIDARGNSLSAGDVRDLLESKQGGA